jgi:hypothetical protein
LKSDDIFDLKNGKELLDKILNPDSKDILSTIKDFLGINDQGFKEMVKKIQSMLSNVSVENPINNANEDNTEKIDALNKTSQKDTTDSEELDDLLACLNQIIALPKQDLPKMFNQDFHEMIKVVKLYELLTKNQEVSANSPQLTEQINRQFKN